MTDYLHIKFEPKVCPQNLKQYLKVFIQNRGSDNIPQAMLQHFRIVKDTTDDYIVIKPFIGTASFRALYSDKKKKKYIVFILTQIINWLKRYTNKISILFYFADTKESNLSKKLIYDIADLLESKKLLSNYEFIISSALKLFYVSEVEAFLIGNSEETRGYLYDFYIVAKNFDKAVNYLIENLENEGFEFIK